LKTQFREEKHPQITQISQIRREGFPKIVFQKSKTENQRPKIKDQRPKTKDLSF